MLHVVIQRLIERDRRFVLCTREPSSGGGGGSSHSHAIESMGLRTQKSFSHSASRLFPSHFDKRAVYLFLM